MVLTSLLWPNPVFFFFKEKNYQGLLNADALGLGAPAPRIGVHSSLFAPTVHGVGEYSSCSTSSFPSCKIPNQRAKTSTELNSTQAVQLI